MVVEDDQFLYKDIRRRIVETVLQAPRRLGLVMLDDSFFFDPTYMPPPMYENFPFQSSYPRAESRTVGAYLVFNEAAKIMKQKELMSPMFAPVDHQMRYAISKGAILTHWAWPPMTCAGSQGLRPTSPRAPREASTWTAEIDSTARPLRQIRQRYLHGKYI